MGSEGRRGQRSGSPAPSQPREALKWTHRCAGCSIRPHQNSTRRTVQVPPALVLAASAAGATLPTADSHRPHTLTYVLIRRMDEAYEAAVEKLGGLDQCKPKAVLLQLQVGGTSRRRLRAAALRQRAERDEKQLTGSGHMHAWLGCVAT